MNPLVISAGTVLLIWLAGGIALAGHISFPHRQARP